MSKQEKLIEKMKGAKTADFEDIHQLLILLGFNWRNNSSHYTYTNAPHVIGIVKHGQKVKTVYLKNVQDLLGRMGL